MPSELDSVERTRHGFVVHCRSDSGEYSFYLGREEAGGSHVRDSTYVFTSRTSRASYFIQFIANQLSVDLTGVPEDEADVAVLVSHFRWETDYQSEAGSGQVTGGPHVVDLPAGDHALVWTSSLALPEGEVTESSATPFAAYASVRHGAEVLTFAVQGIGPKWTVDELGMMALRTAYSVCPADGSPPGPPRDESEADSPGAGPSGTEAGRPPLAQRIAGSAGRSMRRVWRYALRSVRVTR
jgi:hypothetical protein